MTIESIEGNFKLNQHKCDEDHVAIADALAAQDDPSAQAIAKRMVALRPQLHYASRRRVTATRELKEHAMTLADTKRRKASQAAPQSPSSSSTASRERPGSASASASTGRATSR